MKKTIEKIEQLTFTKWLNLFQITYKLENGNEQKYFFASRRKLEDLTINGSKKIDAIKLLPYFKSSNDGKWYVILNLEFREPLGHKNYDLCAGLAEDQQNLEKDVKRELFEELGAKAKNIQRIAGGETTAGLTDERMVCFTAEVESLGKQHLEQTEDIERKIVALDDIPNFLKENSCGLSGALLLQNFYYQKKLELAEKNVE